MAEPSAMPGRYFARCASVPATVSQAAQTALGMKGPGTSARPNSSTSTHRSR